VTFITSSALGFLVRTHREFTRLGGEMAIAAPSAYLHRTMMTLGVDRVFPVFDTDEEAIRHFGGD